MTYDSEHFEEWAGQYDDSISPYLDKFPFIGYYEVLSAVNRLAQPAQGMRVLDVGIGTGLLSAELARAGGIIYGIDFSEKMLEKAALKVPLATLARVDLADDHFGRFNQERFDRIISSYTLHHLDTEQQVAFFRRAAQDNLSDSGKIIIADIGFETRRDYDNGKVRWRQYWDEEEYYLCGEEIVTALEKIGVLVSYRQESECAGVLIYEK